MITERDVYMVASSIADTAVLAHGKSDEYTRGVMDAAEAIARGFVGHVGMSFFAPMARDAIRRWEFEKTPAANIVIDPGEM